MIGQGRHLAVVEIINAQADFNEQCAALLDARLEAELAQHGILLTCKP
jgi:hypothetical protein